jgi:peptide deformylase
VAQDIPKAEIQAPATKSLIADMKRLLAKEKYGVALAAPQVGASLRLFVVSGKIMEKRRKRYTEQPADEMPQEDVAYINPVVQKVSRGAKEKHEGCLSVRGFWGEVPRAEKMTISYYDEAGAKRTRGASGFLAHIFQHEMDHLDGVLYIDKASKLYEETAEPDAGIDVHE